MRCRIARAIRAACREELPKACKNLRVQMQLSSVHHPSWVKTEKEKVHRTICRVPYHLAKKSTPGAVPLYKIYKGLHSEFMRTVEETADQETDHQRKVAVELMMEQMMIDLERLQLEEERVEPGEDAPDAENIGIEEMGVEGDEEERVDAAAEDDAPCMREEAEAIIEQDPEFAEAAGPHGALAAPRVIFAKPCTCRDRMTQDQACKLRSALIDVLNHTEKGDFKRLDQFVEKELPALRKAAICYTGLRSILTLLNKIRALIRNIRMVENSFGRSHSDFSEAADRNDWKFLPQSVRSIIEATFAEDENSKRMVEDSVRKAYGKQLKDVADAVADTESIFCDLCQCAQAESKITRKTKFDVAQFMREDVREEREADPQRPWQICKRCMTDVRKGKRPLAQRQADPQMPRYSAMNMVDFDPVPKELKRLNWIEQCLVQLIRPVQQTVCLRDVGGRRTSMLGVEGPMVLLPVPTEGTIGHVVETLPSDAGLTILVNPENAKSKLVRLPVVLRALRWLVANNPLYEDITINPAFRFSRQSVTFTGRPRGAGPVTDAELDELVTNIEEEPSLLRYENVAPQITVPVDADPPSGTAAEQYALLKNPYEPSSVDTPNLDCMAYPTIFPKGRFGMDSPGRLKEMTCREMIKWWLACKDRRCARNPNFLSFLYGLLQQRDMTATMGIRARMNRGQLQGEAFEKALEEGSAVFEGAFSLAASKNMRGHSAYWDMKKKELRSHVALFGPPTFFITLNPAEKRWEELGDLYQMVYGAAEVTRENLFEYISKDPYWFARCFQQRLRAVFDLLLRTGGDTGGPLGRIIHYYWRIEYQHRGTQHAHCVLWVEGAPSPSAPNEERLAFIDRYITARMPDERTEPELYEIVKRDQLHYETHSNTCRKEFTVKDKKHVKCRFDFPRPVAKKTFVNKNHEHLNGLAGSRIKMYYLKRRPCDTYVNDYNPAITLAWKGNTDVQFVWSGLNQVVTYITSYATKSEKSKDVLDSSVSLKEAMNSKEGYKAMIDLMRMRQAGLLEVVDTINGHDLCRFDSGHVSVNTNASDKRDRTMRPRAQIEAEKTNGDPDPPRFMENAADHYYPGRAADLEDFCYFNIMTRFEAKKLVKKARANGDDDVESDADGDENVTFAGAPRTAKSKNVDPFELHFNVHTKESPMYDHCRDTAINHFITGVRIRRAHVLLGRPLVPRFFWPNLEESNEESREDYFRRLCMLFIPWRWEHDLKGDAESFEERWMQFAEVQSVDHPEAFEDIMKIIDTHQALTTADREVWEMRKAQKALLEALHVDDAPEDDGPLVFDREVDEARHEETLTAMNAGQRKIYDEILQRVELQEEYTRAAKEIDADRTLSPSEKYDAIAQLGVKPPPLLRVVVGTAGCGKSFLINAVADVLTLKYTDPKKRATKPAVVLGAPTGLAAVQIRGSTLHLLLGLEVQHGHEAPLRPLKPLKLNGLRMQFKNVKLLIIDEMSMLSNVILMKVHMRLQEISGNKRELFGGYNVLMLGDLMQLPPVGACAIFEKIHAGQINRVFSAMLPECALFDHFDYAELTENMRQSEDKEFGDLLQRLRVQALTDDDIALLRTRVIERERGEKPMEAAARTLDRLMREGSANPMALFGTNAEVRDFNQLVVGLLQLNSCVVVAEDSFTRKEGAVYGEGMQGKRQGKSRRIYQETEYDISRRPGSRRSKKSRRVGGGEEDQDALNETDTNKAAGMEKNLMLAENGRVMLRRNLEPAAGLVNGACGVLRQIIWSADGAEVIALKIMFDGALREKLVEKVSATFDISDDERQTRRQFPVTMAFGATVHKAQGQTLSAVIVATAHFFAAGQGFVALSRVRTLDTLYLVDLHPAKMLCSLPALHKSNELRISVGLPPFAEPIKRRQAAAAAQEEEEPAPANAPPATPAGRPTPRRSTTSSARLRKPVRGLGMDGTPTTSRPKRSRRSKGAAGGMDGNEDENVEDGNEEEFVPPPKRPAASPRPPANRRASGLNDVQIEPALSLRNYAAADCFIIAAVNLIHTLVPLREAIIAAEPILHAAGLLGRNPERMRELAAVLRNERTSVVQLRAAAGYPDGVGDARLVFFPLMQDYEEIYDEFCLTSLTTKLKCPNGHDTEPHTVPKQYKYSLDAQKLPVGHSSGTIEELFEQNVIADNRQADNEPTRCGVCGVAIDRAEVDVRLSGRYLIVEINRTKLERGRRKTLPLDIIGCNATGMRVFGHSMRMVGCIEHAAWQHGDNGHYKVWRRSTTGTGWSIVDDDKPAYPARQLPNKLNRIHIIVFEKIE